MSGPWVAAFIALSLLVAALTIVTLGALRNFTAVLETLMRSGLAPQTPESVIGGLAVGQRLPDFVLLDANDRPARVATATGTYKAFLLIEAGCGPCEQIVSDVRDSQAIELREHLSVVTWDDPDCRELVRHLPVNGVFFHNGEARGVFQTTATPYLFVIDAHGIVRARGHPDSTETLLRLLGEHELASLDGHVGGATADREVRA